LLLRKPDAFSAPQRLLTNITSMAFAGNRQFPRQLFKNSSDYPELNPDLIRKLTC
jgi:hypothetical protein